jgi:hypothetical protein
MNKCTQLLPFVRDLFDDQVVAQKAARIVAWILGAQSPRMSEIAREMGGNETANYKCVQRFLEASDPREVLLRMFREETSFVVGDPTEMPRPQAKKTEYVGTLSDGEGKPVILSVLKGETRVLNKIFYKGKVFVNVIGMWRKCFSEPMWVMTNLKAEDGLAIYL